MEDEEGLEWEELDADDVVEVLEVRTLLELLDDP